MLQSSMRVKSFDALKLFAIFLVLWGHCIQYFTTGKFVDKPIYVLIYSFHMPLFMMISGYFALSSMSLSPINFVKKKFVQLLLPSITWGVCMQGMVWIFRILHGQTLPFVDIVSAIIFNFWFLKSLFLCYMLAYVGRQISQYFMLCGRVIPILFILTVGYFSVQIMFPCFLVGMYLKSNDFLWKKRIIALLIFSLVIFIGLLCFWNKSFWDYTSFSFYSFIKKGNYPWIYLYREIYRILIGIAGSLTFFSLFYLLFKQVRNSKIYDICCEWGKYTLGIYVLQTIIIEIVMKEFVNFDGLGFILFNFVVTPFISICVLVVCVLLIKQIYKHRILSFLFFGKS